MSYGHISSFILFIECLDDIFCLNISIILHIDYTDTMGVNWTNLSPEIVIYILCNTMKFVLHCCLMSKTIIQFSLLQRKIMSVCRRQLQLSGIHSDKNKLSLQVPFMGVFVFTPRQHFKGCMSTS